jgi:hypothetical protein
MDSTSVRAFVLAHYIRDITYKEISLPRGHGSNTVQREKESKQVRTKSSWADQLGPDLLLVSSF